jgi:hypothetical protein
MIVFRMASLVCKCLSVDSAGELAQFMEKKFNDVIIGGARSGLKCQACVAIYRTVSVYCEKPVNEMGQMEFKEAVKEFKAMKMAAMNRWPTMDPNQPGRQTFAQVC